MTDEEMQERRERAEKIAAQPDKYKVCEGCDSIVTARAATCPNCHGYRFDDSPARVIEQARALASRPRQSVTSADLEA